MSHVTRARIAAFTLFVPSMVILSACGHHAASTTSGSSGSCSSGFVSGKVAGQPKCLQAGQQCQQQNASDYKKYGFSCTKSGGRYSLSGTTSATKPSTKHS